MLRKKCLFFLFWSVKYTPISIILPGNQFFFDTSNYAVTSYNVLNCTRICHTRCLHLPNYIRIFSFLLESTKIAPRISINVTMIFRLIRGIFFFLFNFYIYFDNFWIFFVEPPFLFRLPPLNDFVLQIFLRLLKPIVLFAKL